jgi:hypothetical protein
MNERFAFTRFVIALVASFVVASMQLHPPFDRGRLTCVNRPHAPI